MVLSKECEEFLKKIQTLEKKNKIVFTNGCFDLLHRGHITYLNEAKKLGNFLFVGINSDQSIKKLKGSSRPIVTELDRKFILENLKCVDCVEIFDDETPLELIRLVKPQILVKGGDWKVEDIVGSEDVLKDGGEVFSLTFHPGHSTTNIIKKIEKNSY